MAWLILHSAHPSVPMVVLTIFVVAIGEITQQPRYYEYISRLAPPDSKVLTWDLPFYRLAFAVGRWMVWWKTRPSFWRSHASTGAYLWVLQRCVS